VGRARDPHGCFYGITLTWPCNESSGSVHRAGRHQQARDLQKGIIRPQIRGDEVNSIETVEIDQAFRTHLRFRRRDRARRG